MSGYWNWRGKLAALLLVIGLSALLQGCGQNEPVDWQKSRLPEAEVPVGLIEMNRTADELYTLAAAGKADKAAAVLDRLAGQAASASYEGITGIEGAAAFTHAVVDAKREFQAVRPQPELMVKAAARLKLAADALTHPKQPMWLHYYKVLSQDANLLEQAVSKGNQREARAVYARMSDHYDTIRPAVWISRSPEEGEKMDSLLTFFTTYTGEDKFRKDVLAAGITHWRQALLELFRKEGDRTAYAPAVVPDEPVLWTVTIGMIVAVVLAYAGWQMIRSERNMIRNPGYKRMDGE